MHLVIDVPIKNFKNDLQSINEHSDSIKCCERDIKQINLDSDNHIRNISKFLDFNINCYEKSLAENFEFASIHYFNKEFLSLPNNNNKFREENFNSQNDYLMNASKNPVDNYKANYKAFFDSFYNFLIFNYENFNKDINNTKNIFSHDSVSDSLYSTPDITNFSKSQLQPFMIPSNVNINIRNLNNFNKIRLNSLNNTNQNSKYDNNTVEHKEVNEMFFNQNDYNHYFSNHIQKNEVDRKLLGKKTLNTNGALSNFENILIYPENSPISKNLKESIHTLGINRQNKENEKTLKNNKMVFVHKNNVFFKDTPDHAKKESNNDLTQIVTHSTKDITLFDNNIKKKMKKNLNGSNESDERKSKRSSRFRGVSKNGNQWQVLIMINKKKMYIGSFTNEEEAARNYDYVALKNHGTKAKTNFFYSEEQILSLLRD